MKVSRFTIKACCGKTSLLFKTDQPLNKNHLSTLISLGFKENEHLSKSGILYVDNLDLIVSGPFGADRLQVKCKMKEREICNQKINDFEMLLNKI